MFANIDGLCIDLDRYYQVAVRFCFRSIANQFVGVTSRLKRTKAATIEPAFRLLHSHTFCLVRLRKSQWFSLRKQQIFRFGLPAKQRLRNKRRNSIMMTLTSQIWVELLIGRKFSHPVRSSTQFWVLTRHRYGISALISRESTGSVAKYRLFSEAISNVSQAESEGNGNALVLTAPTQSGS